uniref:Uncharacterized protein n=1 Tax=Anguilla anguilla TaxID=7936 RepID=A0A0E9QK96_ANGAN
MSTWPFLITLALTVPECGSKPPN